MNILEAEDMVKGLPDQVLFQIAQNPPPNIPQFLAVSEVQRRQDMRQRYQAQQPEATVKDQILQGGIASTGEAPMPPEGMPMAPQGPPQMAPQAPPMGQPPQMPPQMPTMDTPVPNMGPVGMSRGGQIPGGPGAMKAFLARNLSPRGLIQNAASLAGALSPIPGGAALAGNLAQRGLDRFMPEQRPPMTAFEIAGLTGVPFSEMARREQEMASRGGGGLQEVYVTGSRSPMPMGSKQATVTVEELPEETGMFRGGLTPGGIVQMQQGRQIPDQRAYDRRNMAVLPYLAKYHAPRRPQFSIIRDAKALADSGRTAEAVAMLQQEGIDPARVLGAAPPMEPTPVAPQASPQAAPQAAPAQRTDMMATLGVTPDFGAARPTPPRPAPPSVDPGIPAAGAALASQERPAPAPPVNPMDMSVRGLAARAFAPQEISPQEQAYIDLVTKQQAQGLPPPVDLGQYVQAAQQRQQEARDEARRMAIANSLMGLGSGLMAGDPAAGLQRATQMATETLREGRKEAQAEGRMAEQLQLQQAQQERQDQIEKMQLDRESVGKIADIYRELGKSNRESQRGALQVIATYDASLQSGIRSAQEQGALDRRAFVNALSNAEEQIEKILAGEIGMSAEEKNALRQTLRERAVRQYAAAIPGIDVASILSAGRSSAVMPKVGEVRQGYKFKGGDPSKESSWEKI